jgi:hypothetical protein
MLFSFSLIGYSQGAKKEVRLLNQMEFAELMANDFGRK